MSKDEATRPAFHDAVSALLWCIPASENDSCFVGQDTTAAWLLYEQGLGEPQDIARISLRNLGLRRNLN